MFVIKDYNEIGRRPAQGDKVAIVNGRIGKYWNPQGGMDRYFGTTLTVSRVLESGTTEGYALRLTGGENPRDAESWIWYPWMIEGIVIDAIEDIFEDPSTWASGDDLEALLT